MPPEVHKVANRSPLAAEFGPRGSLSSKVITLILSFKFLFMEVFVPIIQLTPVVHFQLFMALVNDATAAVLVARFEFMLNVYPPDPF